MESKETLRDLIDRIKAITGMTQEEIADRADYRRSYLSDAISKGGNDKIINAIKREFENELSDNRLSDMKQTYKPVKNPGNDYRELMERDRQMIKTLSEQNKFLTDVVHASLTILMKGQEEIVKKLDNPVVKDEDKARYFAALAELGKTLFDLDLKIEKMSRQKTQGKQSKG